MLSACVPCFTRTRALPRYARAGCLRLITARTRGWEPVTDWVPVKGAQQQGVRNIESRPTLASGWGGVGQVLHTNIIEREGVAIGGNNGDGPRLGANSSSFGFALGHWAIETYLLEEGSGEFEH